CPVIDSDDPCRCGVEIDRLRAVEAEAIALLIKVEQHQHRGWDRIALGAHDRLRAVVEGRPSTAARLDALCPVPCGEDETGGAA
ncbi:hypothetical protein B7P34_36185, partial [Streptosporangium nondiastaticum]